MAPRRLRLLPPLTTGPESRPRPVASWRVAGASVRGTAHAGGSCQDVWLGIRLADGGFAAAIADGAGSTSHGGVGAAAAVGAAIASLRASVNEGPAALLDQGVVRRAMDAARAAIRRRADQDSRCVHQYATTLSVVAGGADRLVWGQIGDGALVAWLAGDQLELLAKPDQGQWANETVFLTDSPATDRVRTGSWVGELRGVALLTDGLRPLALHRDGSPFSRFFMPLFEYARTTPYPDAASAGLAGWLRGAGVRARTADDVTLVLAMSEYRARRPA